jgi:hypothetical protein
LCKLSELANVLRAHGYMYRLERVQKSNENILDFLLNEGKGQYIARVDTNNSTLLHHCVAFDCDTRTVLESDPTFPFSTPFGRISSLGFKAVRQVYRVVRLQSKKRKRNRTSGAKRKRHAVAVEVRLRSGMETSNKKQAATGLTSWCTLSPPPLCPALGTVESAPPLVLKTFQSNDGYGVANSLFNVAPGLTRKQRRVIKQELGPLCKLSELANALSAPGYMYQLERVQKSNENILDFLLSEQKGQYIARVDTNNSTLLHHCVAFDCDKRTVLESDATFPFSTPFSRISSLGFKSVKQVYRVVRLQSKKRKSGKKKKRHAIACY